MGLRAYATFLHGVHICGVGRGYGGGSFFQGVVVVEVYMAAERWVLVAVCLAARGRKCMFLRCGGAVVDRSK